MIANINSIIESAGITLDFENDVIPLSNWNEGGSVTERHILFALENYDSDEAAKAKADEVLNMWLEGEKTEDSFAALATEYTEDPGSQTTGGLYEDVKNGDMVTEFNDWLFDSSRTLGDYGIVKTSYGYHIMYFAGDGEAQWKADVEQAMKSDYYSEKLEEYKKAHTVTFYDEIISEIDM